MKRAVLMSRVSSDEQALGYSLGVQKESLEKYCERHNIEVAYHFSEDHSAKNFERPAYNEFLKYIKSHKNEIDLLLFTSWDRFSRNITDALVMIRNLSSLGITAQAIEQPIDLTVPENKAMLALYLVMPEVDNDRRSIKIRGGMRAGLKAGRWLRMAPKGYSNKRDDNNKPIIVPSNDVVFIKYIFDEVLKGKNQAGIRLELQEKGFRISKTQISDVLRNPVYIGKIVVPKEGDEEYQLVEGLHEAIVSEDVFYKVQNILQGKKKVQGGYFAKEELPLRGSLFCSNCGGHVTGSASRSKTGKRHFYYHCNHCSQERFPAEKVNESFSELLSTIKFKDNVEKLYEAILKDKLQEKKNQKQQEPLKIELKIGEVKQRLLNLQDMLADKSITPADYQSIKNRYVSEIEKMQQSIQEESSDNKELKAKIITCLNLLQKLDNLYENADLKAKKAIVSSTFPEKLFFDGKNCRTPRINEVLLRALSADKGFRKTKSGLTHQNLVLSALVEPEGVEPSSKKGN